MDRLTKRYPNGNITLEAAQFGIDQDVLDSEIRNSKPIKTAVKRLAELEEKQILKVPNYEGDGYDGNGEIIYDTA